MIQTILNQFFTKLNNTRKYEKLINFFNEVNNDIV